MITKSPMSWRLVGAAAAIAGLAAPLHAATIPSQGTWATTLQARDINADGTTDAFYDTVLNITWLADAKAALGSGYDTTFGAGYQTWTEAAAWAAQLNVHGVTGWRLPTMIDTGALGCDAGASGTDCGYNVQTISADGQTVYSELAHLYYVTLGNLGYCAPGDAACSTAQAGWGLTNTGDFRNLEAWVYWFAVPYAPFPADAAWAFNSERGRQGIAMLTDGLIALPVRPGDVTGAAPQPVSEPQALLLALLALGAAAVARRHRSAGPAP